MAILHSIQPLRLIYIGMAGQSLAGAEASLAVAEICGDLQRLLFFGDSTPAEHHGDPCRPTASRIRRAGAMAAAVRYPRRGSSRRSAPTCGRRRSSRPGYRGACHRARIRAIRWLVRATLAEE